MCDFKVGDEVAPIKDESGAPRGNCLSLGMNGVYVVDRVIFQVGSRGPEFGLVLVGEDSGHPTRAYVASSFRKVERRNLTEWLSQSVGNTDKLDKKKVRVK